MIDYKKYSYKHCSCDDNGEYEYRFDENEIVEKIKKNKYHTNSKIAELIDRPHYTNHDFDKPVLIFGKNSPELFFNYDDRIMSSDATKKANASGAKHHTAQYYENYLTAFHGKPCDLKCIYAEVNHSNGFPTLAFGYIIKP